MILVNSNLNSDTRVLRQDQRSLSQIQYREFDFPDNIRLTRTDLNRPIKAILREKVYTKTGCISCYFELNDEKLGHKKVILTARPERKFKALRSTVDMRTVPLDSPMTISIGQGSKYLVWLLANIENPNKQ